SSSPLTEPIASVPTWRIWVDTGGTFTDAIGVDPRGRVSRLKLLSTSALRGVAVGSVDGRLLQIERELPGPDDLTLGFAFRWLGADAPSGPRVEEYRRAEGLVRLSAAPPAAPAG